MLQQTQSQNGEGDTNDICNIDMNIWLKQNRLTKLQQYFQENEVIIDDLLKYSEDDMKLNLFI